MEGNSTEHQILSLPTRSALPAVSVIIPLYNAERYVGECLDSLLAQTFKNFEVIIVDDYSTDNSRAVVESYAPKFDGRLKLAQMEKNSGAGSLPRNKGLRLSRGEFIYNMDNDDALTPTALEEMYTLAKRHNVDFVYCEKYYSADDRLENRTLTSFHNKATLVDKPTVEMPRLPECLDKLWVTPWTKLIKRKLLIENQIFFPNIIRDDTIWTWCLLFYAKRFLRVPNAVYIWREVSTSITRVDREPAQVINFWLNPVILGVKTLNDRLQTIEFFQKNPQERYALLENFIQGSFKARAMIKYRRQIEPSDIFKAIKEKFAENLGEYDALIPALCSILIQEETAREDDAQAFRKFKTFHAELQKSFTARIDIDLSSKNPKDFQIVSVSDTAAEVKRAAWLPKSMIGYFIQSHVGKLEIIAKVNSNGLFRLYLRGLDIREPEDNSKRIQLWIDYTKLIVNGKKLFDKVTPVWHDKPYGYTFDAKAGEEIRIQVEWLPHSVNALTPKALKQTLTVNEKFLPYLTARLDVKLSTTDGGELKILSVSDNNADIKKSSWLKGNDTGYFIQSHAGKLELVIKAVEGGRFNLGLLGMDVPDLKDKSKHLPYWIDYTKLAVNGKVIFDELTPACHDKPYRCNLDVKADEEIVIQAEWLPHQGDVPSAQKTVAPAPIQSYDAEIINRFKRYFSVRLDLHMATSNKRDFEIISISDDKAEIRKPAWFNRDGVGYVIQSYAGKLAIVFKIIDGGSIKMELKGLFYADLKDNSKHIPYWVDYTKFSVNDKIIFNKLTPVWHDKPYRYNLDVKAGDEIKIQMEWLPHRSNT